MNGDVAMIFKKHQGDRVGVTHFPGRKKPCLYVYLKNENTHYIVASFASEEMADWFIDVIKELFDEVEE